MTYNDHTCARTRDMTGTQATPAHLDCSLSVKVILVLFPSTRQVFNRFGLDTCCGAGLSVADAARAADADAEALCSALTAAIAA